VLPRAGFVPTSYRTVRGHRLGWRPTAPPTLDLQPQSPSGGDGFPGSPAPVRRLHLQAGCPPVFSS
jgi:hypothetical protein